MSVNAAGGFLRIARGLWRLCRLYTNAFSRIVAARPEVHVIEAIEALKKNDSFVILSEAKNP
jgi:hypothetical protein